MAPLPSLPLFSASIMPDKGFSILTGTPAAPVAATHSRSPVIIPAADILGLLDLALIVQQALRQCVSATVGAEAETRGRRILLWFAKY